MEQSNIIIYKVHTAIKENNRFAIYIRNNKKQQCAKKHQIFLFRLKKQGKCGWIEHKITLNINGFVGVSGEVSQSI